LSWVYLNGEFVPASKACVSIEDRGFLFGDGVFTTLKVEEGMPEQWELHLERLFKQCAVLNIIPPKLSILIVQELIEKNRALSGIWKLKIIITGGKGSSHHMRLRPYGSFLAMLSPYTPNLHPLRVCRYPYPIESPLARLKTLSYVQQLMVKQYALDREFDDALVVSSEGYVLESAFANVFWKEEGQLFTPSLSLPLLPGTRLQSLPALIESFITYDQLLEKQEIYLCNSMHVSKIAVLSPS
jgi:branched-subunit amino acid aminotransferase/4-amino-4-deoxychorismate lyase